jgi:hypothetical protein
MKSISRTRILPAACLLLLACEKADESGVKGNPLTLTGPTEKVVLLEENEKNTAVTFTWSKGVERNPADTITYIFRMDIAGNNFATATPRDTVTDFTKSFTVDELNSLISEQWKVYPGEEVSLEARVVANVRGEKFAYPEIAVTAFTVVTYAYASVPLYMAGSAVPGGSPVSLTQLVNGRQYSWQGSLNTGSFKILYSRDDDLPSLSKGADSSTLVERTDASQPDDFFEISQAGLHRINVDRKNMKIDVKHFHHYFERVYFVGDAVPAGWDAGKANESAAWDDGKLVYEGPLTADGASEDAFKILTQKGSWDGYNLRPAVEWAPITDNRLVVREGGDDWKWKIKPEESGMYRVTVDLSAMTITFEKLD